MGTAVVFRGTIDAMRPLTLVLLGPLLALVLAPARPAWAAVTETVLPTEAPSASAPARALANRSRIDVRLGFALAPDAEPVAVWVEFADKGEQGPGDLVRRLTAAEGALTGASRARRERAHVTPLVDILDLPVEPSYLHALEAAGFAPYGASRWFNRVAVRASGARLAMLASFAFVRHVAPVELAFPRDRERVLDDVTEGRSVAAGASSSRQARSAAMQANYGQTFTQLQRLNVPAVHDSGYIGRAVNVCVLDDGFNWYRKHEALRTIPVGGGRTRDFIRGDTSVQDTVLRPFDFEHGTTTLSVVAGRRDGRYLAPAYGCNVVLGRTEESATEKPIEMVYWSMGAEWADSLGCDIITSSLGYNLFADSAGTDITYPMLDGHTTIITRAASIAAAKGILVVTSAGNDGLNARVGRKISAPADANGDSVLAIGAVDSLGVRVGFSSKGPTFDGRIKPDLVAQGVAVLMVDPLTGDPNVYKRANGTSFSAPLVAGLAACLMQARPTWPPVLIVQALKRTASRAANPDTLVGWGIPDGLAALRYVPDTLNVPDLHASLSLRLAGPNPLRPGTSTSVRLALGSLQGVKRYHVRVLDAAGRVVRDLAQGTIAPGGILNLPWRGDDANGRALSPGLYFLALDTEGRTQAARVVVLR